MDQERHSHAFLERRRLLRRLEQEPSTRITQPIAVGIDPGSKKEALVVKSAGHTYLNVQADAVTWVKEAVTTRRQMRRARRQRTTPCRCPRFNRARGGLPPSTKAHWQWKLRLCRWLFRLYPISTVVVEDIKAATKGKRRWDARFSPLEVGKRWFYSEHGQLAPIQTRKGWETKSCPASGGEGRDWGREIPRPQGHEPGRRHF